MKNGEVESFVNLKLPSVPPIGFKVTILHPRAHRDSKHYGYIECEVVAGRMMQDSPNQFLTLKEK